LYEFPEGTISLNSGGKPFDTLQLSTIGSAPYFAIDNVTVVPTPQNEGGTVASVQRLGVHQQSTQLLIFFNGPLDPAQAEDTSHYTLTTTGRRPRAIALDRAVYDPTTRSVTLLPHERLSLTVAYRLTVRGGGPHGTDFTTEVYGGGFPRWVGATGPGLSNSPLGNDGPTAAQVDALFSRSARISAQRHRR
jgi:hypothetical protein